MPPNPTEEEQGTRVAFFGGSFDPPHLGHLAVACAARDALHLDKVLFCPVGAQPLKPEGPTASFADRVAMTRLAIASEPSFEVSLVDAPKPASMPNYTYDSLVRVRTQLRAGDELFCLMGADSLHNFSHWYRAAEIPFIAPLIVVSRPGQSLHDVRSAVPSGLNLDVGNASTRPLSTGVYLETGLLSNPSGETSPLNLLSGVEVDISATHVREWLRAAEQTKTDLSLGPMPIDESVLHYIEAHRIYC